MEKYSSKPNNPDSEQKDEEEAKLLKKRPSFEVQLPTDIPQNLPCMNLVVTGKGKNVYLRSIKNLYDFVEPETLVNDRNLIRNYEATGIIRSANTRALDGNIAQSSNINNKRITLAGNTLEFPEKFLTKKHKVTLKLMVVKRRQYHHGWKTIFGPEFIVTASAETLPAIGPVENTFRATLNVPTCYIESDAQGRVQVEIQETSSRKTAAAQFWVHSDRTELSPTGEFSFNLRPRDSRRYRFLMDMDNVEKIIAHMIFVGRSDGNDVMIWAFCDNLMETKFEIRKQMELNNFILLENAEPFRMSREDNVRLALKVDGCEVDDSVQTIPHVDIWFSDSIVQKEFIIRGLEVGRNVEYKVETLKKHKERRDAYICAENTFTFPDLTAQ